MYHRDHGFQKKSAFRWVIAALALVVLGTLIATGSVFWWYQQNIKAPSSTVEEQVFVITDGETVQEVGQALEQQGLIRSARAFEVYTRLNNMRSGLLAGGYSLSKHMDVKEIMEILVQGKVATDLVTILPAQSLGQVQAAFTKYGYTDEEINESLKADQYRESIGVLADLPKKANLEGYLYPDSYQRNSSTTLQEIISQSLTELDEKVSDELVASWKQKNLNIHQAITIASIVEKEVSKPEERSMVAQVFLKRYEIGMELGSDPTALYGASIAGIEPSVFADTPYNTRLYPGLPPGPIGNVSISSLEAIANPADTDYLYFVSGDDGKTYFSRTLAEHEALTREHCIELCKSY